MTKTTTTKKRQRAEDAYAERHHAALQTLARIQQQIEDLPAPETNTYIHWGHVGELGHVNELLNQIETFLANEE